MLTSAGAGAAGAMLFFHRPELTMRYASLGLTLAAPGRDRLLNACEPNERRRLQRHLARPSAHEPAWLVEWQKMPGDALQPREVVATLSWRCGVNSSSSPVPGAAFSPNGW